MEVVVSRPQLGALHNLPHLCLLSLDHPTLYPLLNLGLRRSGSPSFAFEALLRGFGGTVIA